MLQLLPFLTLNIWYMLCVTAELVGWENRMARNQAWTLESFHCHAFFPPDCPFGEGDGCRKCNLTTSPSYLPFLLHSECENTELSRVPRTRLSFPLN